MFGYILINKPEMKFREFDRYRSYYCGLCHKLKEKYGFSGQLTLSYDMTFLIMLLTGLYEPQNQYSFCHCLVHPIEKHPCSMNQFTDYCADLNLLLLWYKCMDDWQDEHNIPRLLYGKALQNKAHQIEKKYPDKAQVIEQKLKELHTCEEKKEPDIDIVAGLFGEITAEIFAYQKDSWEPDLRKMGFYLGKYIYILDAYEDLEADSKKNNYNPLIPYLKTKDFQRESHQILTMMMAECCKAFEKLPVLLDVEILRNILYSGIWTKFDIVTAKRNRKTEKDK